MIFKAVLVNPACGSDYSVMIDASDWETAYRQARTIYGKFLVRVERTAVTEPAQQAPL